MGKPLNAFSGRLSELRRCAFGAHAQAQGRQQGAPPHQQGVEMRHQAQTADTGLNSTATGIGSRSKSPMLAAKRPTLALRGELAPDRRRVYEMLRMEESGCPAGRSWAKSLTCWDRSLRPDQGPLCAKSSLARGSTLRYPKHDFVPPYAKAVGAGGPALNIEICRAGIEQGSNNAGSYLQRVRYVQLRGRQNVKAVLLRPMTLLEPSHSLVVVGDQPAVLFNDPFVLAL
jgi:hypothetical protein